MQIYNFTGKAKEENKIDFKEPGEFLKRKFEKGCIFGQDNLLRTGTYKEMGWSYDFKPFLKRFLVKQYGNWSEYYCLNKTTLRKLIFGKVEEIREL